MSSDKLIIGLTGGIGSGKSAVAELFARLGIAVIDADIASRKVVEPGQPALKALAEQFGDDILLSTKPEHTLNRQKLRSIIFSDPEQRQWVNDLLHPLIRDWMDKEIAQATSPYVIKVIPLLIESALEQQIDRILVVDVDEKTQMSRVMARDNSSLEEVKKIIQSQASRADRLAASDDVINNDSSLAALENAVKKMHNQYLRLAAAQ